MNEKEERLDYPQDIVLEDGDAKRKMSKAVYPSPEPPTPTKDKEQNWNLIRDEEIPD